MWGCSCRVPPRLGRLLLRSADRYARSVQPDASLRVQEAPSLHPQLFRSRPAPPAPRPAWTCPRSRGRRCRRSGTSHGRLRRAGGWLRRLLHRRRLPSHRLPCLSFAHIRGAPGSARCLMWSPPPKRRRPSSAHSRSVSQLQTPRRDPSAPSCPPAEARLLLHPQRLRRPTRRLRQCRRQPRPCRLGWATWATLAS